MFFKIGVLKNFAILESLLSNLQAFFYRTPTLAAPRSSRQQMLFPDKSGMYWRPSHRFLSWTPWKTQRLNLRSNHCCYFVKRDFLSNFVNLAGKQLYRSLFLIQLKAKHRCFHVEFTKVLKIEAYERLLMEPVLLAGVFVVISYASGSNQYILVPGFCFVIFVTVSFANFSFVTSTIDTTIIRSSRLVVFCQKGVLTNFAKFTIKHQRKSFIFKEAANLQSLNLSK